MFYIRTSLEHYRYFKGWHPKTRAVQGSETVLFKHKYITAPAVTPADVIIQAAKEVEVTIKNKLPPPLVMSGIDKLEQCTNIFGKTLRPKTERRVQHLRGWAPGKAPHLRG